ncbi:MAG: UDP-3-O-(3-hydroxymyristoyl)glucosamine N-acyltransferase [Parvibaculaceae bacterium]|nr:UDP-3-O-(3-hydroxymyristoyl)glucosamine N-acyltransferase [Parvibaculaceae bacterium]HBM89312.1 UDP-3-O-(3-hydroxymyristoyl)glucosamine N-acyltransferase [Rhodobiaceae bacterium]|tara:strand:+ start:2627 stop:3688 length:1062 start_codon:yes stop_codon:yes gene_type:complete
MADLRFFEKEGPFSLGELASRIEAIVHEGSDETISITDVAPLDSAGPDEIAFLDNPKYVAAFEATKASACIVGRKFVDKAPAGIALLVSDQPYRSYALAAQCFYPTSCRPSDTFGDASTVSPAAHIHPSAKVNEGATIEPGAVVSAECEVGSGAVIASSAVVAKGTTVGRDSYIGPGASISHAHIGDRVIIHAGVRIGQDGFGFAMGLPTHEKIPQLGRVIVQDDVEIGANTTIDRGAGPDTIIGAGTKIDNLVQIGHNVVIGQGCIIVAQCGLSGSGEFGDYVALGARVGTIGHIKIGDGVQIAARSSVIHDIPAGQRWGGTPAKPVREWQRELIALQRMAKDYGKKKGSTA